MAFLNLPTVAEDDRALHACAIRHGEIIPLVLVKVTTQATHQALVRGGQGDDCGVCVQGDTISVSPTSFEVSLAPSQDFPLSLPATCILLSIKADHQLKVGHQIHTVAPHGDLQIVIGLKGDGHPLFVHLREDRSCWKACGTPICSLACPLAPCLRKRDPPGTQLPREAPPTPGSSALNTPMPQSFFLPAPHFTPPWAQVGLDLIS